MSANKPDIIAPETLVHRMGGGGVDNLRLRPKEALLNPLGISVLLGGTPQEAAEQMRQAFPDLRKFRQIHDLARSVGTTTVGQIRLAGFEVIPAGSRKFPNHARLIHPGGAGAFTDANLALLSQAFVNTATPRS